MHPTEAVLKQGSTAAGNHLEGGREKAARDLPGRSSCSSACSSHWPNPSITQTVKIMRATVQVESRLRSRWGISSVRRLKIHSCKNCTNSSVVTKMGKKSKKEGTFGDFPGGAGTKTALPMQGAWVQSPVREIDPTCRN